MSTHYILRPRRCSHARDARQISRGREQRQKNIGCHQKTHAACAQNSHCAAGRQPGNFSIDDVVIGDTVLVRPGASVRGRCGDRRHIVSKSAHHREALPVEKHRAARSPGSINSEGLLKFEVSKVGEDTALAQIIKLVEDAQSNKGPIAQIADKVAGYFVPIVIIIAILAGIGWGLAGKDFDSSRAS